MQSAHLSRRTFFFVGCLKVMVGIAEHTPAQPDCIGLPVVRIIDGDTIVEVK